MATAIVLIAVILKSKLFSPQKATKQRVNYVSSSDAADSHLYEEITSVMNTANVDEYRNNDATVLASTINKRYRPQHRPTPEGIYVDNPQSIYSTRL